MGVTLQGLSVLIASGEHGGGIGVADKGNMDPLCNGNSICESRWCLTRDSESCYRGSGPAHLSDI